MHALDPHRGEIFFWYIAKGTMSRTDLLELLHRRLGFKVTPSQLRDKLSEWDYRRYTSRAEARIVAHEFGEELNHALGNPRATRHRPIDLIEQIRRYGRTHPEEYRLLVRFAIARRKYEENEQSPMLLERPLQMPVSLGATTKFQYDLEKLIHRSFHTRAWTWQGNGLLIESSKNAGKEKSCIMKMIHGVDLACNAARDGRADIAGHRLEEALEAIDQLVVGEYHDNIPNILAKINDLNDRGFRHEALTMKQRVSHASRTLVTSSPHITVLYRAFEDLELEQLGDLEESCGIHTTQLFEQYVGPKCYSSFVMKMNSDRRKLLRDERRELDISLPSIPLLDAEFGESNARPLDVLRVRIEVLYQREVERYRLSGAFDPAQDDGFYKVLFEAQRLIDRAARIINNPWQYHYFLIQAHYYAGLAQYYFGRYQDAKDRFQLVRALDLAFREVDRSGQFDGEVAIIEDILRHPCMQDNFTDGPWEDLLMEDILCHPDMDNDFSDGTWDIVREGPWDIVGDRTWPMRDDESPGHSDASPWSFGGEV